MYVKIINVRLYFEVIVTYINNTNTPVYQTNLVIPRQGRSLYCPFISDFMITNGDRS